MFVRGRQELTHTLRHGLSGLLMSIKLQNFESPMYLPVRCRSTWLGRSLVFGLVLGILVKDQGFGLELMHVNG